MPIHVIYDIITSLGGIIMKFDPGNLITIAIILGIFALQLILCFKARPVIVKLFPTILCILATIAFIVTLKFYPQTLEGFEAFGAALGYLVLFIVALIALGGCVVAWIIYGIATAARKSKAKKLNT